ncbi:MAG: Xaa-Pro peptidase family protein [Microgenomates group bacterium]
MISASSFLQSIKTDAFLVSQFHNILYLGGFLTLSPLEREAYLLIVGNRKVIITDSRYEGERHSEDSELLILKPGERVMDIIGRMVGEYSVKTLGFEADNLKWNEVEMMKKLGVELTPIANALSKDRAIKTEEEIFAIKQACHIGDLVLKDITPYIHPGQTEKEIAWYIEKSIREGYNGQLAFDPIVAVDANAASAHYNTKKGEGVIKDGSIVLLDFGVEVHNYNSDITRMVAVGEVSDEIKNAYADLLDAQKKTVDYASSANELKAIDIFCRSELQRHSHPNYGHSTGHGIGLEVHEFPRLSATSLDEKKEGQVFTIEPGIYHMGKWGMRLEDTVTVSHQGEIEVLTRFPKELILL